MKTPLEITDQSFLGGSAAPTYLKYKIAGEIDIAYCNELMDRPLYYNNKYWVQLNEKVGSALGINILHTLNNHERYLTTVVAAIIDDLRYVSFE
jgi:hypothetical protein